MKIAFFGIHYACNYFHIGGTDSFVRRISVEAVQQHRAKIDYVLYGAKVEEVTEILPGLRMRHFMKLEDAQEALLDYDHVVTIYLPPRDRAQFMYFRLRHRDSILFHIVYFSWPDSRIKRELMFADSRLVPFTGCFFTISPRQHQHAQKWCNPILLWPPVPDEYFVSPELKPKSSQLRITWIGRIDLGKGVQDVIDLFRKLANDTRIEAKMCGHRWESCTETEDLHHWLMNQKEFNYINTEYAEHSSDVEQLVGNLLRDSDIFILPYRILSSTIDTPLLMLEAMASLSAVLTKPMGDLSAIYQNDDFLLVDNNNYVEQTLNWIEKIGPTIEIEHNRLFTRNQHLKFSTSQVTKRFLAALNGITIDEITL